MPKHLFIPWMAIAFFLGTAVEGAWSRPPQPSSFQSAQNTPIGNLNQRKGITISGKIIRWGEADENEFILQDASGTVLVDAGPRWWKNLNLNIGDQITVTGEMDEGEFDAFTITNSQGQVIEIRPPQGSPPWEGSRRDR